MTYQEFLYACQKLKEFMQEQDKLEAVLKVISPTSTAVCEFGNSFIDSYIRVVEIALTDEQNWFGWFVFENDFGRKKKKVVVNKITYTIASEADFYKLMQKLKPNGNSNTY